MTQHVNGCRPPSRRNNIRNVLPDAGSAVQMAGCNDLKRIRPQNPTRIDGFAFDDWKAQIAQEPRDISRLSHMLVGGVLEPTHAIDFSFASRAIGETVRPFEMLVKPIKHIAKVMGLPVRTHLGFIVPDISGRNEQTLVRAGINVPDVGFKSDIHEVFRRNAQAFFRKKWTELGFADLEGSARRAVTQLILRKNTSVHPHVRLVDCMVFWLHQLSMWKPIVFETRKTA